MDLLLPSIFIFSLLFNACSFFYLVGIRKALPKLIGQQVHADNIQLISLTKTTMFNRKERSRNVFKFDMISNQKMKIEFGKKWFGEQRLIQLSGFLSMFDDSSEKYWMNKIVELKQANVPGMAGRGQNIFWRNFQNSFPMSVLYFIDIKKNVIIEHLIATNQPMSFEPPVIQLKQGDKSENLISLLNDCCNVLAKQ